MPVNEAFIAFVLGQLAGLDDFETKNMFGGVALLSHGSAFAKIKHGKVWLKVDDSIRSDFERWNMPQYTYGKDNSRTLNFYETPVTVLENREEFLAWAKKSLQVVMSDK